MPKVARTIVKVAAAAGDRLILPETGVVVLLYHRVGGASGLDVDLPVPLFRQQMETLAQRQVVITLDDALSTLADPPPDSPDSVVITFDDGTADFADVALPVLQEFNLPATLYVTTDFIDRSIAFPNGGRPLSWEAMAGARASGLVTIGSHTHRHTVLDRATPETVEEELDRSRELIAEHIGENPRHFAYPKALPGSAFADAAVRARFESAALAGTHSNPFGKTDVWRLARSPIQVSDGMRWFRHKLSGGMVMEDRVRRFLNRARYAGVTS